MISKIKFHRLLITGFAALAATGLTSCFEDEETTAERYKEWKEKNEIYLSEAESKLDADGKPYYTRIEPSWAPNTYFLIHWHNDRKLTQNNLSPMDNSTVKMKYELYNIEDIRISDSYANADSVYTSRPSQNIIGVWSAMTHMNVGDSVTVVIPASAGYGEVTYGGIPPYSTLIYNIKMKAVSAYEVP